MMRILGITAFLGALLAGCASPGGVAMPAADVDAVNAAIEAHRAAFNARHLDALLLGIAEEARVVSLPAFGAGRAAGDGQVTKVQYREDITALMVRGDQMLLEHASWTVTFFDPTHAMAGGEGRVGNGRALFSYWLERRGDRWVITESRVKRL